MIAKRNVLMHEVADRLHPRPSRRQVSEQAPRIGHEPLGLAVAAAEQDTRAPRGATTRPHAPARTGNTGIGKAAVVNEPVGGQTNAAGGRNDPRAGIAEAVHIHIERHWGRGGQKVGAQQVAGSARMHIEHENHGNGLRAAVHQLVAKADLHVQESPRLTRCNGIPLRQIFGRARVGVAMRWCVGAPRDRGRLEQRRAPTRRSVKAAIALTGVCA